MRGGGRLARAGAEVPAGRARGQVQGAGQLLRGLLRGPREQGRLALRQRWARHWQDLLRAGGGQCLASTSSRNGLRGGELHGPLAALRRRPVAAPRRPRRRRARRAPARAGGRRGAGAPRAQRRAHRRRGRPARIAAASACRERARSAALAAAAAGRARAGARGHRQRGGLAPKDAGAARERPLQGAPVRALWHRAAAEHRPGAVRRCWWRRGQGERQPGQEP
mmetsp:Transcript_53124/g.137217  ORF Transcript_53124/g.137217 Transcript_53124/m.137217 type:complete len:223 (+) Transcript_53124:322-990(+)